MNVESCYWCGAPATSREHVPPKCIFPATKDAISEIRYRDNLITVPSCEVHNLRKSKDDEYLMAVLAFNADNNEIGVNQGITKVARALLRSEGFKRSVLFDPRPARVIDATTGEVTETATFTLDLKRIEGVFEHIGRGIYFHHFKNQWVGGIKTTLEFNLELGTALLDQRNHPRRDTRMAADSIFLGLPRHGSVPKVFYYQLAGSPSAGDLAMRLTFYDGTRVSLLFGISTRLVLPKTSD